MWPLLGKLHLRKSFYLLEGLMKFEQELLSIRIIIASFGHNLHLVEGEVLKLRFHKLVFRALPWNHISQIQALLYFHTAIHTSSKDTGKHKKDRNLRKDSIYNTMSKTD